MLICLSTDLPAKHSRCNLHSSGSSLTLSNILNSYSISLCTSSKVLPLKLLIIIFAAIDDDSFRLERNPVDYEIAGGGTAGAVKTYDGIRDNRTSYSPGLNFDANVYSALCCQVFRCNIAIPGDQRAAPNISSLSVAWLKDGEEIIHVAGRTEIDNDLRYSTANDETRYVTQFQLIQFQTTDAGVYQCVYSDFDNDGEVVFSSPFRLDSGSHNY